MIFYRKGYKYQLASTYQTTVAVATGSDIVTAYILLGGAGNLTIMEGYAWDGPSGPTVDTPSFMRGSLVHDALYQLMRDGYLDRDRWRQAADEELKRICLQDGMNPIRAWYVYQAVRFAAASAADPRFGRAVISAP